MSTTPTPSKSRKSSFSSLLRSARPSSRSSATSESSPPLDRSTSGPSGSGTFRRPGTSGTHSPRQLLERAKGSLSPKLQRGRPGSASSSASSPTPADLARRAVALYEARALALFPALPFELQAHILSFLDTRTLVRNVARADRYYAAMVDGLVKGAVRRAMGRTWGGAGTSCRLVFEAQRPIDTLTTKHALYFSHFQDDGVGTVKAHFDFLPLSSNRTRAESKSREREPGAGVEAMAARTNASAAGWRYPRVPEAHRERLGMRELSASVPAPSRAGEEARVSHEAAVESSQSAAAGSSTAASTSVSPAAAAPITVPQTRREEWFTDVASPHLHNRYNRTELVSDEAEAEASSSLGTEALAMSPLSAGQGGASYATTATTAASTSSAPASGALAFPPSSSEEEELEDIDAPMDAYDWAGPISASADAPGRHSRSLAHKAESASSEPQRPTYRFELDPLDSFESWCLSLTLQRRDRDAAEGRGAGAMAMEVGEERRRGLRWEKRVAEGLDRTFRNWWTPSSPSSSSIEAQAQALEERMLELDASCTLRIQPHPSASLAQGAQHPAHMASSHTYLSLPPLTAQYLNSARVKLTFHTASLCINAARLAAQLGDVEEDVERAREMALGRGAGAGAGRVVAGFSGGSSWSAGMGGSRRLTEGGVWTLGAGAQGAAAVIQFGGAAS